MKIVILPNYIRDAINAKLDAAYIEFPEAAIDREYHYHLLLEHFDQHGEIADLKLTRKVSA